MLYEILWIIFGFVLLVKGADFLITGASSLAKRFNVPDLAIGMTVIAMGTSMPELVINIIGSNPDNLGDATDNGLVFGNIIGSNIFNIFLILGISSIIYPLTVKRSALFRETPFSFLTLVVLAILCNDELVFGSSVNQLDIWDGVILSVLFVGFLAYLFRSIVKGGKEEDMGDHALLFSLWKSLVFICLGIVGLAFGGNFIVTNAVVIAVDHNISQDIIGLTLLAGGTSLPELATSVVAAFQKKSDLAFGNIIGSNIFNILLVLGLTSIINPPLRFSPHLNLDMGIIMVGTFLLFLFMVTGRKMELDRWEGGCYLLCFAGYLYFLFVRIPV